MKRPQKMELWHEKSITTSEPAVRIFVTNWLSMIVETRLKAFFLISCILFDIDLQVMSPSPTHNPIWCDKIHKNVP